VDLCKLSDRFDRLLSLRQSIFVPRRVRRRDSSDFGKPRSGCCRRRMSAQPTTDAYVFIKRSIHALSYSYKAWPISTLPSVTFPSICRRVEAIPSLPDYNSAMAARRKQSGVCNEISQDGIRFPPRSDLFHEGQSALCNGFGVAAGVKIPFQGHALKSHCSCSVQASTVSELGFH